jgi:hypothetical protein
VCISHNLFDEHSHINFYTMTAPHSDSVDASGKSWTSSIKNAGPRPEGDSRRSADKYDNIHTLTYWNQGHVRHEKDGVAFSISRRCIGKSHSLGHSSHFRHFRRVSGRTDPARLDAGDFKLSAEDAARLRKLIKENREGSQS